MCVRLRWGNLQTGGRFVQDEQFRSLSERRCDHDKLALASRYVGVGLIGEMGYAQVFELINRSTAFASAGVGQPFHARRASHSDHVDNRVPEAGRMGLGDVGDLPGKLSRLPVLRRDPVDQHGSGRQLESADKALQERRFSLPVASRIRRLVGELHSVENLPFACGIGELGAFDFEEHHQFTFFLQMK